MSTLIVEPAMGLDLENWGELEDDVFLDEVKGCMNIKTFITSPGRGAGKYTANDKHPSLHVCPNTP